MKTQTESKALIVCNQYTAQFKEQALSSVDRHGIPKVAQDLGLSELIWYSWRAKRRLTGLLLEDQKLQQAEMASSSGKMPAWKRRWPF